MFPDGIVSNLAMHGIQSWPACTGHHDVNSACYRMRSSCCRLHCSCPTHEAVRWSPASVTSDLTWDKFDSLCREVSSNLLCNVGFCREVIQNPGAILLDRDLRRLQHARNSGWLGAKPHHPERVPPCFRTRPPGIKTVLAINALFIYSLLVARV